MESKDVRSILDKNGKIRLPLFIKKNNDEGQDFYYMGDVTPQINGAKQTTINSDSGKPVSVVKIRFDMQNPVSTNMYTYLHEKGIVAESKPKTKIVTIQTPQVELKFRNSIPLYNLYAAAGTFSEMQSDKDFTFIDAPTNIKAANGYFACKVVGKSMNRRIPNGSICLFKEYTGGSRNGKIVLVENRDTRDPDFNSAFTVKTYSSEKTFQDGTWSHNSIVLRPNSFDKSFIDIVINEQDAEGMRVVGEFVRILEEA